VDPVEVGPVQEPSTDLLEEAQVSAGHGIKSIEKGELDAGIAWLQSALAFAQNARHARLSAPVKVVMPGVSE
jgi:ABC-type Fe3+ transport system substrate-binding protein